MVFIELVPKENEKEWYASLRVGDVLTFRYKYDRQETITHRIIEKNENLDKDGNPNGWYTFVLKGDNKALANDPNASAADTGTQTINTEIESANYIIGKVTGQDRFLGFVAYALKQPICIALIIIVPDIPQWLINFSRLPVSVGIILLSFYAYNLRHFLRLFACFFAVNLSCN
jgi:hypothetical protein